MNFKTFKSSDGNVWKYVFNFENAIAESVLYRYNSFEDRTVICCSVQSGCPVGCIFCGTGKQFIRNLTEEEIVYQIDSILKNKNIEEINSRSAKFQIMFMSMGEPFLNMNEVSKAIKSLNSKYPNAELLVSTVGINNFEAWKEFLDISASINKIGLQFSLHSGYNHIRNELIPYKNKFDVRQIRDIGVNWWKLTGRPVYLNYCVHDNNLKYEEIEKIKDIFPSSAFYLTFSVICSPDQNMKEQSYRQIDKIKDKANMFFEYNTRIFDPAGQDDIGGGCGQLWYTQDWIKQYKKG